MQIMQEQLSVRHMDVLNADNAGAIICEEHEKNIQNLYVLHALHGKK